MDGGPKELERKKEKIKLLEKKIELQKGLPHLYGWRWYKWARDFFESTNKFNFLCAANQISKSSTQIRKCIHWATEKALWPDLWRDTPNQFWYLYPSRNQVEAEFETKWRLFLPWGKYENDPKYGWKAFKLNKEFSGIRFNSGVNVYFKTYTQDVSNLQGSSVYAHFVDEELPLDIYDELVMRLSATDGYFHMVFTATLGQEFWRQTIEPKDNEEEKFPHAWKKQVSMYDCLTYEDGTPSHWTEEKIQRVKNGCKSEAEIQRRVYGKFVRDSGLKYASFNIKTGMVPKTKIPDDWHIYSAVDHGSGGEKGHPAAIIFVAIRPDYQFGRVVDGWRGDGIETEPSDVVRKFREIRGNLRMHSQRYDWASKDFFTIANRMGEPFHPANKDRAKGEQVLNVLFKNGMLKIDDTPELQKLAGELMSLSESTPKNKAKDDLIDALRYAISDAPWDWGAISTETIGLRELGPKPREKTEEEKQIEERRAGFFRNPELLDPMDQEFMEANEAYGE